MWGEGGTRAGRFSVLASLVVAMLVPASGADAALLEPTGLTKLSAGASCWAIKQAYPLSTTGVYWLQTPTLVTPQQFYCDMTTDGGGWVLVARGREGWTFDHNGQRGAPLIRGTPSGTGAFKPAALSAATVDGLLDGARPDALQDGVRIRRATNTGGSAWQELRWRFQSLDRWSWGLPGGYLLSQTVLDGTTYTGGNTYDSRTVLTGQQGGGVGSDDGLGRLFTWFDKGHKKKGGFSYGNSIGGQNNSTSYLWEFGSEDRAIAFTQVYIRPRLEAVDWQSMPAEGLPAEPLAPRLHDTTSLDTPWGVTGLNRTPDKRPQAQVQALGQVGDTVFVGGKFATVQQGAGGTPHDQPYLAGFDVNTGEWRSGFRPHLDGAVWDMVGTADGRLIVGGEFGSVNGEPNTQALAALDPVTGEVLDSWTAEVALGNGNPPFIRAMDEQDGWVYIGGNFNRLRGGDPLGSWIVLSRMGRVKLSNGKPAGNWKPQLTAATIDIDASPNGDRVYAVGNFGIRNSTDRRLGVFTTTTPAAQVPGLAPWVPTETNATYQQAILEVGDGVVQGGAEHNLHLYDRATYGLERSHITKRGGDFQAIAAVDGVVYAACHCVDWNYQDTNDYRDPNGHSRVDEISFIGAYDSVTLEHDPEFQPRIAAIDGWGAWELMEDSNGCMWFGGDVRRGSWYGSLGGFQWLGGFGKFCSRDVTSPSPPHALWTSWVGVDLKLTWPAATDDSGSVTYEVLRDGRVIATPSGRQFKDLGLAVPAEYAVRAVDATGNRSATTPVAGVTP